MSFLEQKVNSFIKSVKGISPHITVSESAKSGQENLFFHESRKSNFRFTTEQKID